MRKIVGRALICAAVMVVVAGCQTKLQSPPTITEIETPPEVAVSNWVQPAVRILRARIDTKGWAYAAPYFVYAPTNVVLDPPQATLVFPHCWREQGSPTAMRCLVNIAAPAANWHFQWGLDYGFSGSDTTTVERPEPPGTFSVSVAGGGGPPQGVILQPPPPQNPGPLVLFDPPNGATCAGTFFEQTYAPPGVTSVRLAWRGQNTQENIALPGDYQIVVEHAAPPNCDTAPGLNLSDPNVGYGYDPQIGCYVARHNVNDTSPPMLQADREYRWRVRRILANGLFEPFTNWSTFTTAGPACPP